MAANRKTSWTRCAFVSFCWHTLALIGIVHLTFPFLSPSKKKEAPFEKLDKTEVLEMSFQPPSLSSSSVSKESPLEEAYHLGTLETPPSSSFEEPVFDQASFSLLEPPINIELSSLSAKKALDPLEPSELPSVAPKKLPPPPPSPVLEHGILSCNLDFPFALSTKEATVSSSFLLPTLHEVSIAPTPLSLPSLPLPDCFSLQELKTTSYSQGFEIELFLLPEEEDGKIPFAITLIPKETFVAEPIPQHITFLVDCSNSIQKHRLDGMKHAVYRAIEHLPEQTYFNILGFDQKITRFSNRYNLKTRRLAKTARTFLNGLSLGSFFSNTDLLKPLLLCLSSTEQDTAHAIVLLTDAEALQKKGAKERLLYDWTLQNQERASLHVIGLSENDALSALETVSTLSGGTTQYAYHKRSLRRKLLKLCSSLARPLAKDLSIHASLKEGTSQEISIEKPFVNYLYAKEPLVLFGKAKTLEDFTLFIQGKNQNRWMQIKKKISFATAKPGTESLKLHSLSHQAYRHYQNYLREGDPAQKQAAKDLVQQHDLPLLLP